MSKAEEFIKKQSHIIENPTSVWISSYNARKAVEIAREEMVEKGIKFLKDHLEGYDIFGSDIERSVESFKLAMEDE